MNRYKLLAIWIMLACLLALLGQSTDDTLLAEAGLEEQSSVDKQLNRGSELPPLAETAAMSPMSVSTAPLGTTASLWQDGIEPATVTPGSRLIEPSVYRFVTLDVARLLTFLPEVPMERSGADPVVMSLPLPDGRWGRFAVVESPVMEPELAAKFPELKTYAGQGIDDTTATVRLDWTPHGFHAIILSGVHDTVYIDPYQRTNINYYMSYWRSDYEPIDMNVMSVRQAPRDPKDAGATIKALAAEGVLPSGDVLRTYRAAVAATGEYTQFHGGTVADGMAAIVVAMNRVNAIYEREVAIHMNLVANNELLIYTNGATDPYTNNNGGTMLGENQTVVDSIIGDANYDIGHVFSTGGGGVAYLGSVCDPDPNSLKAGGVTGLGAPIGDPFYVDYVAHEIGHQFGANHTFNSTTGACSGGNRNDSTAYEPGSASTIMGYAGICGADNLQSNSDDYFHAISFDEMTAFTQSGVADACAVKTSTGNNIPVPNAGTGGFTIPAGTPFELTGSATDADSGDALTYNWEQFDLDPGNGGSPSSTTPPFFRSWPATTSPTRIIPRLENLLNNTLPFGETYPTVDTTLTFRMTVRDNQAGAGAVDFDTITFDVDTGTGPFLVTAPNTAVTWLTGSSQTITWDVAGTTAAPVSCANVDIMLSYDGGYTYPTTLASATPNDGSEVVTVPATQTLTARTKVACSDNIFFDLSNEDFYILAAGPQILTSPTALSSFGQAPNTTVNRTFNIENIGDSVLTWSFAEDIDADCLSPADIGWISTSPASSTTAAGATSNVTVTFDSTGLGIGTYTGNLCLTSDDVDTADQLIIVPITLNVEIISCTTYVSNDTPIAISATGAPQITSQITVADANPIFDVNVTLNATHTWINDLDFTLESPQATTIEVLSQTCADQDNLSIILDDESTRATGSWPCPPVDGLDYQPSNPLAGYNDESAAGTWTMFVQDHVDQDGGSFNSWSLEICTRQPAPEPGRQIEVSPTSVSNTQVPDTTSNATITVTNVGDTTLTWSVTEDDSSDCNTPTDVSWLSATPTSGMTAGSFASDAINLSFDSTGLTDAVYTGYICITSDDDDPADQLKIIPVSMNVQTLVCTTYSSTDVGKPIPSAGNSGSTTSIVNVSGAPAGYVITDANLLNLVGTHGNVGQLNFNLNSPANTNQQLLNFASCGNVDNFDLNVDQEATPGAIPCPPVGGGTYQPNGSGNLTAYNGEDSTGTWTLTINDTSGAGGAGGTGSLTSWDIELCVAPPPPEPAITVSPTSLSSSQLPNTVVGSSFVISNTGDAGSILNWTDIRTDDDNNCSTTETVSWITGLAPTSGSNGVNSGTTVSFNFNSTGLAAGNYNANFCIDSNDAGSPTSVPLSLTVQSVPPPVIGVEPTSLATTLAPDTQTTLPLTISNTGGDDLTWMIFEDQSSLVSRDVDAGLVDPVTGAAQTASVAEEMLRQVTLGTAKVSWSEATGHARFVNMAAVPVEVAGASMTAKAEAFLTTYGALFGITDASNQLALIKQEVDQYGHTHITYGQWYRGVPVWSALVRVHLDEKGGVTAANGVFVPDVKLSTTTPVWTVMDLTDLALATALDTRIDPLLTHDVAVLNSQLIVFRTNLVEGKAGTNHLAYEMEIGNRGDIREFVYIDAITGKVLDKYTGIQGISRELYEGAYDPGNLIWQEGDPLPGTLDTWQESEVVSAEDVYNFFENAFGYISYDDADATMVTVNNDPNISCPNANWNGVSANYCTGTASDDVVAHEWGHAYTEYTHGLIYAWQSGALNESYSDIWGETIDQFNSYFDDASAPNGAENNALRTGCGSSDRWRMGEQATAFGGAIRDMWDPTCDGDPGKLTDAEYWCSPGDSGGVHINSGVPNHGYALLVDGGTYNGQTITALGWTKAAHIYWRTQTVYQTPTSNFIDHADALEASCNDLLGVNLEGLSTGAPAGPSGEIITTADCTEVTEMIAAIELRTEPTQCYFEPMLNGDALACGATEAANFTYSEDFEGGTALPAGWTVNRRNTAATFTPRDWEVVTSLPNGRVGNGVYAPDPIIGDCQGNNEDGVIQLFSPSISTAGMANMFVSFDHYMSSELSWDGGNLSVRVNGGNWQLIQSSDFVVNAYNGSMSGSPLAGQDAFTGANGGSVNGSWGTSTVDLSAYANPGDSIEIVWEFGTDECNGQDGWYIDDVRVHECGSCGNVALDAGEMCDDGNYLDGDGCSSTCQEEAGWSCTAPSAPTETAVTDGSFEAGAPNNPFWTDNFNGSVDGDTIIDSCSGGPSCGSPSDGTWWAKFQSTASGFYQFRNVSQPITIPIGAQTINFDVWTQNCVFPASEFNFLIGWASKYRVATGDPECGAGGYTNVSVDATAYADNDLHLIIFDATAGTSGGTRDAFHVDNVTITSITPSVCTVVGGGPIANVAPSSLSSLQVVDTTVSSGMTITNVGDADLTWSVVTDTDGNCGTTETVGWVTGLAPTNGVLAPTNGQAVSFNFDSTGLAAGTYNANLCVNSDSLNGSELVALTLEVTAPSITVTPNSLSNSQASDTVVADNFAIGNTGTSDLNWSNIRTDSDGDCATTEALSWVTGLAPTNGTTAPSGSSAINFNWDSTGLAPNTYTGNLCIDSDDANSPEMVPLALTVTAPVACDAVDDISWVTAITPASGTNISGSSSNVDVTVDATGLASGVYTATLCVSSNDTVTPMVEVPVSLTVEAVSCTPPASSPMVMESLNGGLYEMSWSPVGDADQYEIWWGVNDPYFMPGADCGAASNCAIDTASPYSSGNGVGDAGNNYSYVLRAANSCGATASDMSNRTGEFDYGILPGL
ncbi:MAG TPA: zinc-dependent metalloprotease family protein [Anaerolineae bacterium]|nr:zinc-dependent metalloprotease family protein [Anaerolineae bacterium]